MGAPENRRCAGAIRAPSASEHKVEIGSQHVNARVREFRTAQELERGGRAPGGAEGFWLAVGKIKKWKEMRKGSSRKGSSSSQFRDKAGGSGRDGVRTFGLSPGDRPARTHEDWHGLRYGRSAWKQRLPPFSAPVPLGFYQPLRRPGTPRGFHRPLAMSDAGSRRCASTGPSAPGGATATG